MDDDQLFLFIFVSVLLAFIVDIRCGLVLSCIIFGIFLIFFINNKMDNNKNQMYDTVEHFQIPKLPQNNTNKTQVNPNVTYLGSPKTNNTPQYAKIPKQCMSQDCYKMNNDPFRVAPRVVDRNFYSKNQNLQGGQNPKTLIPPMVTKPMYDMDWRINKMVVPNRINGTTNEPIGLAGYLPEKSDVPISDLKMRTPLLYVDAELSKTKNATPIENGEAIEGEEPVEHFTTEYNKASWDDSIFAPNGYDPKQFEASRYPANLPRGNCMRDPVFKEHNETLFSSAIQPGVYYKYNLAEPINSNIGISFQQQFLPRTYENKEGNVYITDHDPNFAPPMEIIEVPEEPRADNVYDPRFTGHGTTYRNYVDKVTGQPRFPYDDVNAIRMPNYLVRSKLDTHPFADTYGPIQNAGLNLNDIRQKAQDAYYEDTTNFRNDLTSRLMRKRNAELWQVRQFPHSRHGNRMMHGGANK